MGVIMQMNARPGGRIFSTKRMMKKKKVEGNEKNVQKGLWIFLFIFLLSGSCLVRLTGRFFFLDNSDTKSCCNFLRLSMYYMSSTTSSFDKDERLIKHSRQQQQLIRKLKTQRKLKDVT
jgi:hypothetical protein